MGLFDTIVVDGSQFQTKALGAWGNTFHPGDPAFVRYLSQTEQEYALNRVHKYDNLPDEYTIEAGHDASRIIVLIREGRIMGVVSEPAQAHFDSHGRSIGAKKYVPTVVGDDDWINRNTEAQAAIAAALERRSETNPI